MMRTHVICGGGKCWVRSTQSIIINPNHFRMQLTINSFVGRGIDMLHKLIITSVIAFFPYTWQLNTAMIVVCLYASALYICKPYVRKSDDRLQLVSLAEIIMLLMSGNVFNQAEYDPLYDWLLSIILIALVILFFIFFVLQALQALYKVIKDYRRSRKQKQLDAHIRAASGEVDSIGDEVPLSLVDGRSTPTNKGQQTRSDWVDEYKAGVDITAAVDRTDLRRKVTGIKRMTEVDDEVQLSRNPVWNGTNRPASTTSTNGSDGGGSASRGAPASQSIGNVAGHSNANATIQL
jgi:uncharacterized membrane protein